MADPEANSSDGKISGNILVLGSSPNGKTTLVQEMASNSVFGKLEGAHWVSAVKAREAEIDSCFKPKVEFYNPQDDYDLTQTMHSNYAFVNLIKALYTTKLDFCIKFIASPANICFVTTNLPFLRN